MTKCVETGSQPSISPRLAKIVGDIERNFNGPYMASISRPNRGCTVEIGDNLSKPELRTIRQQLPHVKLDYFPRRPWRRNARFEFGNLANV